MAAALQKNDAASVRSIGSRATTAVARDRSERCTRSRVRRSDAQREHEQPGHSERCGVRCDQDLRLHERKDERADHRSDEHARLQEPAVERVDSQEPHRRGDPRNASAVAGLRDGSEEACAGHRHEDRPDRPGIGEDDDGGGEHALSESRPAGDAARTEAIGERSAQVRTEHLRGESREDVERRRLGPVGELEQQDREGDDREPVAVCGDAGGKQETCGSIGLRQGARGSRKEPGGVDRHVHSWGEETETKRDVVGGPTTSHQRIQKPRACSGVNELGISPRPAPSAISASMDTAGTRSSPFRWRGWLRQGAELTLEPFGVLGLS